MRNSSETEARYFSTWFLREYIMDGERLGKGREGQAGKRGMTPLTISNHYPDK